MLEAKFPRTRLSGNPVHRELRLINLGVGSVAKTSATLDVLVLGSHSQRALSEKRVPLRKGEEADG